MTYDQAMRALNKAAYDTIRAANHRDAPANISRYSLRLIAAETDRMVDNMTDSGSGPSRIQANEVNI